MAITVEELTKQLSAFPPKAKVSMHSSLENVIRAEQGEDGLVLLFVDSDLDDDLDDEEDGDDDDDSDLEDDICPRCEEEEADCIC
jgi:hypothetical protein